MIETLKTRDKKETNPKGEKKLNLFKAEKE